MYVNKQEVQVHQKIWAYWLFQNFNYLKPNKMRYINTDVYQLDFDDKLMEVLSVLISLFKCIYIYINIYESKRPFCKALWKRCFCKKPKLIWWLEYVLKGYSIYENNSIIHASQTPLVTILYMINVIFCLACRSLDWNQLRFDDEVNPADENSKVEEAEEKKKKTFQFSTKKSEQTVCNCCIKHAILLRCNSLGSNFGLILIVKVI